MKREIIETKNVNFIGCWKIENEKLFSGMINFFEKNIHLQSKGVTAGSGHNEEIKKTTNIDIDPLFLKNEKFNFLNDYFGELYKCYNDYKQQWPFLTKTNSALDIPTFTLQKYIPGDHFSLVHCERNSTITMHRVFAWMTYLNDVGSDNGSTYFSHYDVRVKPEMGKTLIWPAEWTHAHAGEILKTDTKYIISGWMCYPFD